MVLVVPTAADNFTIPSEKSPINLVAGVDATGSLINNSLSSPANQSDPSSNPKYRPAESSNTDGVIMVRLLLDTSVNWPAKSVRFSKRPLLTVVAVESCCTVLPYGVINVPLLYPCAICA